MTASGVPDLGPLDVMVLHTVNYALKKLLKQGVVKADRQGKERLYQASAAGRNACERYREV